MGKEFFQVAYIQKKIDECHYNQRWMKIIIFLQTLLMIYYTRIISETVLAGWLMSMPLVGIFYWVDICFMKKAKEWEWKLYHVQVEMRERKKEVARITGDILSLDEFKQEITMPEDESPYPITYYTAVLALDIVGGLFMLF